MFKGEWKMEEKSSKVCQKISSIDTKLKQNHACLCQLRIEELAPKLKAEPDNSGLQDCREVKDVLEHSTPQIRCKKLAYQKIHIRYK
jgi:hypothetical protein